MFIGQVPDIVRTKHDVNQLSIVIASNASSGSEESGRHIESCLGHDPCHRDPCGCGRRGEPIVRPLCDGHCKIEEDVRDRQHTGMIVFPLAQASAMQPGFIRDSALNEFFDDIRASTASWLALLIRGHRQLSIRARLLRGRVILR